MSSYNTIGQMCHYYLFYCRIRICYRFLKIFTLFKNQTTYDAKYTINTYTNMNSPKPESRTDTRMFISVPWVAYMYCMNCKTWLTDVSTHRHFNPSFQMNTFEPLPIQTFYPIFWTFSFSTPISKTSQSIYRRCFNHQIT